MHRIFFETSMNSRIFVSESDTPANISIYIISYFFIHGYLYKKIPHHEFMIGHLLRKQYLILPKPSVLFSIYFY